MDPIYMMVEADDGGSLLRDRYRIALANLIKRVQYNISVQYMDRIYYYTDLCEPYCEMNTAFKTFLDQYNDSRRASYTYPTIEIFGTQVFIGKKFSGIFFYKIFEFHDENVENQVICRK